MAQQNQQTNVKAVGEALENAFRSISENIKEIVESSLAQTDNVVQSYGKNIASSIKSFTKEADKIIENDRKIRQGLTSQKELQKQLNTLLEKKSSLQTRISNLQKEDPRAAAALRKEYEAALRLSEEQEETLRNQVELMEGIEKKAGALGSIFKGISKIPLVGNLVNAEKALEAMKTTAAQTNSSMATMASGLKAATAGATNALLAAAGKALVDRFKVVDTATESTARSLGISYTESTGVMRNFIRIADASNSTFVTSDKIAKTVTDLSDELGVAVSLDNKRLEFATKLREQGKFSVEFTNTLTSLTKMRGEDEEKVLQAANAQVMAVKLQTGINLNNRKVLESITKASNAIKLNFKGSVTEIAKAAAKTQALGLEMNKVDDLASSMLDFESSIQAQMEAELLTGKALNTDAARYYALTNQTEKLAETIAQDLGTAAEFGEMNRIQQESLAKAYGMSREEVSKMLLDQQIAKSLSGKSLEDLQKQYAEKIKLGKEEEFLKELGEKGLRDQFEQNSLQVRQAAMQEKLAASMDKIASALTPVAEMFVKIGETLSKFPGLIRAAVVAMLAFKAASMFGKGSVLGGGSGILGGIGGGAAAAAGGGAAAGGAGMAGMAKQVAAMKAANPGMTSAEALKSIKAGGAPTAAPTAGGGGFFSRLAKGAKSFASNLNPLTAIKGAVKGAGGLKGFLKKGLKGSALNSLFTGFFAYQDIKDLLANPVDERGEKLSKEALNKKVGGILMGSLGNVLGGLIGAGIGGPIGSIVGSFGGEWLLGKLGDLFPSLTEGFGDLAVGTGAFGTPKLAEGGLVTQTGIAKVDKGEVYLGANSITVLRDMLNALQEQNRHLIALVAKNTTLQVDGQVLANVVARNVPTTPGNLLNPSSRVYR